GEDWVPYWAAARAGEVRFQRCTDRSRWRHPPGPMCPDCRCFASKWARASGRGRLLSWVVVHPPVLAAWKDRVPYPVVLVACEEGVRTIGGLVGCSAEELRLDMPLVVDFAPSPDGDLVPQWRPACSRGGHSHGAASDDRHRPRGH